MCVLGHSLSLILVVTLRVFGKVPTYFTRIMGTDPYRRKLPAVTHHRLVSLMNPLHLYHLILGEKLVHTV